MSLSIYKTDFDACLERAATLLCGPVCAVNLEWEASKLLRKRMRVEARAGLTEAGPLVLFGAEKKTELQVGYELCSLRIGQQTIPVVQVILPYRRSSCSPHDFWVVQQCDVALLRRYVRRKSRAALRNEPPVMSDDDRSRLWKNTVGFLRSSQNRFRRFRIAKKRGVLLLGAPGNGKTMACRWLYGECARAGLLWRNVSVQEYRSSREDNSLGELFHLDRPGVVLFDDFDLGIRDRDQTGATGDHSTFLSELDGMASRAGVVFLFTSNARLNQLDPAFRRPGRIDVIMEFHAPDIALRRRYLTERWQEEIAECVELDEIAAITEGLNFAELEELRKLLVLDYLETDEWNWPRAWQAFNAGRGPKSTRKIGFGEPVLPPPVAIREREMVEARGGNESTLREVRSYAARSADSRPSENRRARSSSHSSVLSNSANSAGRS